MNLRGIYISDVFLGHRNFPHFVIAVRHESESGKPYVLRATIDSGRLNDLVKVANLDPTGDAFLINHEGVLQTPSHIFGQVLTPFPLASIFDSSRSGILETTDSQGQPLLVGVTRVANSPFLLVSAYQPELLLQKWSFLLIQVIIAVVSSVVVIFLVIWWGSTTLVNRIYEADNRRAAVLHEIEYTNKMAHIGRLAAGVAHEINNPMAIINEKVGLMKDLLALSADFPQREKFLRQVGIISDSVKRVSAITHRLLGFARHLPIKSDVIHIDLLIKEVLGFVGREAEHRNIAINLDIPSESPVIESDQGQLQQVFLNIINNALGAVKEGGRVDISISQDSSENVVVSIADNGVGIPPEHLKSIFEPFFSTKGKRGTGLGLSITYGIVQKLGGRISVESEEGVGTTFSVVLPLRNMT